MQPGYYLARPADHESRLSSLLVGQHILIGSLYSSLHVQQHQAGAAAIKSSSMVSSMCGAYSWPEVGLEVGLEYSRSPGTNHDLIHRQRRVGTRLRAFKRTRGVRDQGWSEGQV